MVNDALRGDQDDIEMAFHIYKNGKEERTPFMPQMTFSMKQEGQVWTLNEISITIRLPLADPDLLRTITEKMKPQAATTTTFTAHAMEPSVQTASSDAMVVAAMRTILTAEVTYATSYPTVGFTCSLRALMVSAVANRTSDRPCSSIADWPAARSTGMSSRFRAAVEHRLQASI